MPLALQDNVPPLSPPCPTCGKDMRLVSVTPAKESVAYGYLCRDDHVFELKIED
jgi:hypothetical protein